MTRAHLQSGNRRAVDRHPPEQRPHVEALASAIEVGDAMSARTAARALPIDLRAEIARTGLLSLVPHRGDRRDDGTFVTAEEARQCVLAYWTIAAELLDDPRELCTWLHYWKGGPRVGVADIAAGIADRPAPWRRKFARAMESHRVGQTWLAHLELAKQGILPSPRELTAAAIVDLPWKQLPNLREKHPEVGDMIDGLWTTRGAGRAIDKKGRIYAGRTRHETAEDSATRIADEWRGLLAAWGADDVTRRPQVLDACLSALAGAGGDSTVDLRGWLHVHERLEPTETELVTRQARYVELAASAPSMSAALGRAVSLQLLKSGQLNADLIVEATPDCLLRSEKGAVREWVSLCESAVATGAIDPARAAPLLLEAESSLPRGTETQVTRVLAKWGGAPASPTHTSPAWTPPEPGTLRRPSPVAPLTDIGELQDTLLSLQRGESDPIDEERAVDGILRFREPDAALTTHLLRAGYEMAGLQALVERWLGRETPRRGWGRRRRVVHFSSADEVPEGTQAELKTITHHPTRHYEVWLAEWVETIWSPAHLTGARLSDVSDLLVGGPVESLAMPTHTHGGIDADTFLHRYRERAKLGAPPGRRELASALLRLDPSERAETLHAIGVAHPPGTWANVFDAPPALERTVASPLWYLHRQRRSVGELALWTSASTFDTHDDDDPLRWWLDPGTAVLSWGDRIDPHQTYVQAGHLAGWVLQLPWHPDVAAAHLQPEFMCSVANVDVDLSPAVDQLSQVRTPVGAQTADILGWAATHANKRTRAAAAEALALLGQGGLLRARDLSETLLRLVGPDAGPFLHVAPHTYSYQYPEPPKLSRIASTLKDASRIDEHGERLVLDTVVGCLPQLKEMRGSVALLEIAAEIAERRGIRVELPEPLRSLADGKARTRLADEARRLAGADRPSATLYSPRAGEAVA